ncbi:hypothetical protein [Chryseobacterium mulctrae]|uniref:hypothetical protein n=1 Tax=Chryseobacterium mulctrae TaxID=2576777 RepID=UPI001117420D|nr:hypothetical protein [Chryseobacterium mulctrae]
MLQHSDFVVCRPKTNNYHSLRHKDFGIKLSLDFRKAVENGNVIGYRHLELNTSPHYHFNNYLHNGNDFTPENCIKTVIDILTYLGIEPNEMNAFKVVNIEFGLNIIPKIDIKNLINGLLFYKKTHFKTEVFAYFKKTNATSYKQIKAYAKGLQFADFPQYEINENTFRFEVKSKQAKNIKKYGIWNAIDLTKLDIYKTLNQTLLDEWESILLVNQMPSFSNLKPEEVQFIQSANNVDFWNDLITEKHRNTFGLIKRKYYNMLQRNSNLHNLIKLQIIDKLFNLQSSANSTQKTTINREKDVFEQMPSTLINLESAPVQQNISVKNDKVERRRSDSDMRKNICIITGLDISMQRKGSKYLCVTGLRYIVKNKPEVYDLLVEKYLTEDKRGADKETQFYYLAHNIRNAQNNPKHNRKRFENRNYNDLQLRFIL